MAHQEWFTNGWGVSFLNNEDFTRWTWGDVPREHGIECANLVMDEIAINTMAALTCERGFPEINIGIFEFECELVVSLLPLVKEWLWARTGRNGELLVCGKDVVGVRLLLAELEASAALVRKAVGTMAEIVAVD